MSDLAFSGDEVDAYFAGLAQADAAETEASRAYIAEQDERREWHRPQVDPGRHEHVKAICENLVYALTWHAHLIDSYHDLTCQRGLAATRTARAMHGGWKRTVALWERLACLHEAGHVYTAQDVPWVERQTQGVLRSWQTICDAAHIDLLSADGDDAPERETFSDLHDVEGPYNYRLTISLLRDGLIEAIIGDDPWVARWEAVRAFRQFTGWRI